MRNNIRAQVEVELWDDKGNEYSTGRDKDAIMSGKDTYNG